MIDNLDQTDRLLYKLEQALPMAACAAPELTELLREQAGGADISPHCLVTRVHYLGDEGGIMCCLALDPNVEERAFIVSITHLKFDRRHTLARDIANYQKHRIKCLRRESAFGGAKFS